MLSILSIDQVFKYCQVLQIGEWNWCLMYIYAFTPYYFKCQPGIPTGEVKLGKKMWRKHISLQLGEASTLILWGNPNICPRMELQWSQVASVDGKKLMHTDENVWGCCKNLWLFIMIKWSWSVQTRQQDLSPVAERCLPGSVLLVHFIHCHFRTT